MRVPTSGRYYVSVAARRGGGTYALAISAPGG